MSSSALGEKVLSAAALAVTATVSRCMTSFLNGKFDGLYDLPLPSRTSCETSSANSSAVDKEKNYLKSSANPFLVKGSGVRESVLRKRMTSIGRFSLKSESVDNPSIPVFFLALSGKKTQLEESFMSYTQNVFTLSDFENAWLKSEMPARHPRFHSTVSRHDDRFFEEIHHIHPTDEEYPKIKAELDRHASETVHFSVYRDDLRHRLEHMLTTPIEVSDKLWEVKISNGPLGSSGAISRAKADAIANEAKIASTDIAQETEELSILQRKRTFGGGRPWKDATLEAKNKPKESVLLFRSHHALADGASIMAALSDLCDEAEEIRANVEMELKRWKRNEEGAPNRSILGRITINLIRYLRRCLWFSFGTIKAMAYQGYLQIVTQKNPFDAVKEDAERRGLLLFGRAISWCDTAPLDEVKHIARVIGNSQGSIITVNDVFVSCVTAAVVRQLIEHDKVIGTTYTANCNLLPNINVVIPVHLRGGIVLSGESVGNRIGAFVTRCPGKIEQSGAPNDAIDRLLLVNKSLSSSKNSPAPLVSHYLAKFFSDYLPESLTKAVFKHASANACVAISNNRGFQKKIHINGMTVESAHGFLPLPPGVPIGVVIQSYAGLISLSVTAEKWAVPDADQFLGWVLDEYQRLQDATEKIEMHKMMVEAS